MTSIVPINEINFIAKTILSMTMLYAKQTCSRLHVAKNFGVNMHAASWFSQSFATSENFRSSLRTANFFCVDLHKAEFCCRLQTPAKNFTSTLHPARKFPLVAAGCRATGCKQPNFFAGCVHQQTKIHCIQADKLQRCMLRAPNLFGKILSSNFSAFRKIFVFGIAD